MSALLSANEIRLTYGYQTLLDGVTLAVAAGEKVGMVGRNGCGKTSLLKILTGQNQADSGDIALRRALRVGYLPQEFELDSELSVHENIAAGAADIEMRMKQGFSVFVIGWGEPGFKAVEIGRGVSGR